MGSVKKQRVASFDKVTVSKGQPRQFKPINKRAKAYANGAKTITLEQIRAIKALGKHRVVVYDNPLSNHFTAVRV